MKLDKEQLIKHRFWVLLGVFIPLWLALVVLLSLTMGSAIGSWKKKYTDAETALKTIQDPKNPSWVSGLDDREQRAAKKKQEIWENAWKSQEDIMTWPQTPASVHRLSTWYFGDEIDPNTCEAYRLEGYNQQKPDIIKIVDPLSQNGDKGEVQFKDGPDAVLSRLVEWKSRPTSEEVWLAQEDIWLYRGLLYIVKDTNDSLAKFRNEHSELLAKVQSDLDAKQKELTSAKKKAKASAGDNAPAAAAGPEGEAGSDADTPAARVARLTKEIQALQKQLSTLSAGTKKSDNDIDRQVFTNPTWRMELALTRDPKQNQIVLQVRLTNISSRQQVLGIPFRVYLRDLEGNASGSESVFIDGVPLESGKSFDTSFPVHAVNPGGVAGVEQVFTWRTAPVKRIEAIQLGGDPNAQSPRTASLPLKKDPVFAPKKAAEDTTDDSAASDTASNPMAAMMAGAPVPGKTMKMPGSKGAEDTTPNGLLEARYLEVTPTVRRIPVAMVVVIDQAYLQDLLTAVANSKLRVQTTYVGWDHPRSLNIRPEGADDQDARAAKEREKTGTGTGNPSSTGSAMNMPGMGGMPGMPGMRGRAMAGETASNDMATNLIEVEVYGIASLYERYPPKKAPKGDEGTEANQ